MVYNSCGNRHCPKCQSLDKERWLEKRSAELLPVQYFHVVFPLPEELNPLIWRNQALFYNLLFRCASQTLLRIGADPEHLGARLGFLAVLHAWSQKLTSTRMCIASCPEEGSLPTASGGSLAARISFQRYRCSGACSEACFSISYESCIEPAS